MGALCGMSDYSRRGNSHRALNIYKTRLLVCAQDQAVLCESDLPSLHVCLRDLRQLNNFLSDQAELSRCSTLNWQSAGLAAGVARYHTRSLSSSTLFANKARQRRYVAQLRWRDDEVFVALSRGCRMVECRQSLFNTQACEPQL